MDVEDLQLAVQSLKDVRAWDTLESVAVKDCYSLEYGAVLEVTGKERLHYST